MTSLNLHRLLAEFPASGGAMSSTTFRTVKLIRYVTPFDYFILACEILFVCFIIYYSIEEALEVNLLIVSGLNFMTIYQKKILFH